MSRIKRALVVTTAERYVNLAATFITTIIVSRLLTPSEIGVWAIGMAIAVMATGAREFATGNFLVQQPVLTREDIRGAFTVMVVISTLIAASLAALAPVLASIYGEAKLIAFLRVAAIAILLEVVAVPLTALMRREMAFLDLAIVNVGTVAVFSVMSVVLAAFGWSYMSFAWAWIVAAATSAVLALRFRPDWWVLKPLLQRWRGMLTFGGYNGVNVLLYRMYEILPILILSRVVSLDAVGLYNRTLLVCQVPDKIILGGALPVILPALSAEVRAGANLKGSYLRAVSFITVLQWPTLVLLAILAQPVVLTLLGEQWLEIVPLVRIMALASLFSFTAELNYPVLVSVGAMRDLLLRGLIVWPLSGVIIAFASLFGLTAVALSFFVIIPLQAYISLWFVRRHVIFTWTDLGRAGWRSGAITACSAIGPLGVAAWLGWPSSISLTAAIFASLLAAFGWMVGLLVTRHPLLDEMKNAVDALRGTARRWRQPAAL
jgi:O-antigen/teichoic acid export membrane protein